MPRDCDTPDLFSSLFFLKLRNTKEISHYNANAASPPCESTCCVCVLLFALLLFCSRSHDRAGRRLHCAGMHVGECLFSLVLASRSALTHAALVSLCATPARNRYLAKRHR